MQICKFQFICILVTMVTKFGIFYAYIGEGPAYNFLFIIYLKLYIGDMSFCAMNIFSSR